MHLSSRTLHKAMLCAVLLALIAIPALALHIYQTVDEDGKVGLYTSLSLNNKGGVIP